MTQKAVLKIRDLKELQSSQKQKAELDEFITPFKVKKPRKSRNVNKSNIATSLETYDENDKKQQSSIMDNNLTATPAKTPVTSSRRRGWKSAKKDLPPNQRLISAFYKSCEKTYKIEPLKEEVLEKTPPTPINEKKAEKEKSTTATKRSRTTSARKTSDSPVKHVKPKKIGRKRLFVDDMEQKDDVNPNKIREPTVCVSLISDNEDDEEEKYQVESNSKETTETPPGQILLNSPSPINEPVTPVAKSQVIAGSSQSVSSARSSTIGKRKPKPCPPYKIVEDTNFAVDAFQYGYIENVTHYFLTHFHADHYIGLTRKFAKPLYMSKITARLVRHFIPLEEEYIHELDLNVPITVDGVEIIALDANHCPGAIMLLFKIPHTKKYILHTGDFRAWHEMESEPIFWNHDIHTIYLDTTYISQKYAFCTQYESISRAKEMIDQFRNKNENKKILFVCGSYVIGKEKFWSAIAEEYNLKVWTEENRNKALKAMAIEEYNKWLVDDPHQADMHILAMGKLSYLHLVEHFSAYENHYDLLLALRPSGWEKDSKPQYRGKINIIGIEYSEHSSYMEMKRFIKYLKPQKVISTVPVGKDLMRTAHVPEKWYKYDTLQSSSNYQPRLDEYMGRTPKKKMQNSKAVVRLPNSEMGGVEKFVSPLKSKKNKNEINNNIDSSNDNDLEKENKSNDDDVNTIVFIKSSEENMKRIETTNKKKNSIENPKQHQILIRNQELKEGEMCSIFIENISHQNSSDMFESPHLKENKKIANDNKSKKNSENSSDYFEPKLSKSKKQKASSRTNSFEEIPISQNRRITRQTSKANKNPNPSIPSTISEEELLRQIKLMEEKNDTQMEMMTTIKEVSQTNPLLKSHSNTTNTTSNLSSIDEENESMFYKNTNELKMDLIMDDNKSELVAASQTTMDLLSTPRPLRNRINYYSISQTMSQQISNSETNNSRPLTKSMKYAFQWQQEEHSPNTADADDIIPASQTSKDLANTPRPIRNKRTRSSKSSSGSASPPKISRQNSLRLEKIVKENDETNLCDNSSIDFPISNISSNKQRNLPSRSSSSTQRQEEDEEEEQSSNDKYNITKMVKRAVNALSQKEPDTSVDHIPPELLSPIDVDAADDWI